ncbi:hypothetical protein D0Y65_039690 [Glycine soja]|uniref:PARG catalytic Macro domain-containing protein n=2 Tax=Glycine subgen. Soja TaxID=1462606 RepID=A0A0R0FV85_SOYBN|nr:hypothetical protein D0Y65_039690 [Glycine soja]
MADNEATEIVGVEWFSTYRGIGRPKTRIVAVGELCIPRMTREYTADILLRDINKSFCGVLYHGMDLDNNIGVATGDWIIDEDPAIKAIIHWLAASQVVHWISSHTHLALGTYGTYMLLSTQEETNVCVFQWLQLSKERPII